MPARLVLAVAAAAALLAGCGGEAFQPTHTAALPLEEGRTLGQTFRPASDTVAGVGLLVATFGRDADPDGELTVVLRDGADGPVAGQGSREGSALPDNGWVTIRFDEPVPAPEVAAIEAAWNGAEPVALRANVPPAQVEEGRLLNDPYPGGELLRDGEPAAGDLAFRVVPGSPVAASAGALVRLARGAVAGLLASPWFAAVWVALMAAAVALAVSGFRSGGSASEQRGPRATTDDAGVSGDPSRRA